jgi:hypothetical protein
MLIYYLQKNKNKAIQKAKGEKERYGRKTMSNTLSCDIKENGGGAEKKKKGIK